MENYRVLASGSTGNCEIAFGTILVDCGVPYSVIKPFAKELKLVVISHSHLDHLNITTIKKLAKERPTLRFGIGEWLLPYFEGIKNVDVYEFGKWYDYGDFKIAIGKAYHDVPNCFYRIQKGNEKIFRCTDTCHLTGITAYNYSIYAIESNYNEETVWETIQRIESAGGYAHQRGSINSHLSEQQCNEFYYTNKGEHSQLIRLHCSKTL
jgi:hypothetical protein